MDEEDSQLDDTAESCQKGSTNQWNTKHDVEVKRQGR